jgi:hypothetical protein
MVVSLLVAFVLVLSGPEGSMMINSNYVYAKSSGGGGGGGSSDGGGSSSHSSKGGSSGGGSDKGGSSGGGGGGSDSGGDKAGSNGGGDSGKGFSDSGGSDSKSSDGGGTTSSGIPKDDGNIVDESTDGGGTTGITPNPNDDGFTKQDGPQPIIPSPPNPDGNCGKGGHAICLPPHKDFCRTHPGVCHRHQDGDNVKVIHRTVVVHDRNNTPQTILLNTNTQTGTCFVSSQQVVNVPNLVTQLLNQCASVTIIP